MSWMFLCVVLHGQTIAWFNLRQVYRILFSYSLPKTVCDSSLSHRRFLGAVFHGLKAQMRKVHRSVPCSAWVSSPSISNGHVHYCGLVCGPHVKEYQEVAYITAWIIAQFLYVAACRVIKLGGTLIWVPWCTWFQNNWSYTSIFPTILFMTCCVLKHWSSLLFLCIQLRPNMMWH